MDTLASLTTETLNWLDEGQDTGTTKVNVQNAIRQAHIIRLTGSNWKFLLSGRKTFALESGISTYTLPQDFRRPLYFRNKTQSLPYREVPGREFYARDADLDNDRDLLSFMLWTRQPVKAQPAAASVVTLVSDSAADVGATRAVIVRGETTDGSIVTETINPNGQTPVAGAIQFVKILGVTKTLAWAGTLTLTAGATELLKLLPNEYGRSYQLFDLLVPPTSADVVEYRYYRDLSPLANDNDVTDIPSPFSRILVFDALLLLTAYDGRLDASRSSLWKSYQRELELNMRNDYMEGRTLGSHVRTVRDVTTESW